MLVVFQHNVEIDILNYLEEKIYMILGMGIWVFIAWIGTILAAILCLLYGVYHWFMKSDEEKPSDVKNKKSGKREAK